MRAILTLAGLTIREALRRRVTIGAFVIGLLFAGLLYIPRLGARRRGIELDPATQAALIAYFGLGMIKFFSAVLGIALASGSVARVSPGRASAPIGGGPARSASPR